MRDDIVYGRPLGRDLYFDIKPTPGSWHCFWFLLKMVKFWPSFTNTFPMWGKLFQIFLDPNKKKFVSQFWKVAWCMTCFFHGTLLKSVNKWSELFRFSLVKEQLWRTVINKKIYGLKIVWYEWNHKCKCHISNTDQI